MAHFVVISGLTISARPSASASVPSSVLSHHEAILGQLVEAKNQGKLIPEPGWIPLTDTPVGKSASSPAITFLQARAVHVVQLGSEM